jgi:hypothetical protein
MPQDEFAAADHAIEQAADAIARRIALLLRETAKFERVAPDYVQEHLLIVLLRRHPEILDWLHQQRGEASMRVSVALQDWLDLSGRR